MRKQILVLLFLVIPFFLFAKNVRSQGLSLGIFPPIIEIQTTPPSSPSTKISIQNFEDNEVMLSIELIPIEMSSNGTGEVVFNPQLLKGGLYGYYKGRIQLLEDGKKTDKITLQPQESKQVTVNINLQKGDPPGDYYFAIVFLSSGKSLEDTSLTSIPAGIAANLLLSVGPKSAAIGGITEFSTSAFKNNGPVEFSLKLHNGSKHLVNPSGTVEISNMLGKEVAKLDILPQYVLAQSDRYLIGQESSTFAQLASGTNPKITWNEKFLLGFYTATANLRLEENGNIITEKAYFFAFPIYLFFGIVIAFFILAGVYLKVKKRI